jgi:hypothetical protein
MKTFIKIIVYFGYCFFGGGFLIAFGHYIAYNGLGNFFEYAPANVISVQKETYQTPNKLLYEYSVNNKAYRGYQNISSTKIEQISNNQIVVLYNKTFNNISMIQDITGKSSKTWEQTVGMLVFGLPLLFIFLIYTFADMDKWIGVYTRGEYKSSRKSD